MELEHFVGAFVMAIAVFIMWGMFGVGTLIAKTEIHDICDNYGRIQLFETWYTCTPEQTQISVGTPAEPKP